MVSKAVKISLAAVLLSVPAAVAHAHTGHMDAGGFAHGFLHPLGGIDHILAMVTVGLLAVQIGGRAIWLVPLSFVVVMVAAGLLGATAMNIPFVEAGIALSVLVLGGAVAFGLRPAVASAMALVGVFAIFHGYAHGAEMPASAATLSFGAGFALATALLHAAGLGLGLAVGVVPGTGRLALTRSIGGLVAIAGAGLLVGF